MDQMVSASHSLFQFIQPTPGSSSISGHCAMSWGMEIPRETHPYPQGPHAIPRSVARQLQCSVKSETEGQGMSAEGEALSPGSE